MKKLTRPIEKKLYSYFENNGFEVIHIYHYMSHTTFTVSKGDIKRDVKLATGSVNFDDFLAMFEDYWNTISK